MSGREWRTDAACREVDPELFFPGDTGFYTGDQIAAAKAVCAGCAVIDACVEFAHAGLPSGIAGGLTHVEREQARRDHSATGADPATAPGAGAGVVFETTQRERAASARAALRAGIPARSVARRFGLADDTAYRWAAEVRTADQAHQAEQAAAAAPTSIPAQRTAGQNHPVPEVDQVPEVEAVQGVRVAVGRATAAVARASAATAGRERRARAEDTSRTAGCSRSGAGRGVGVAR